LKGLCAVMLLQPGVDKRFVKRAVEILRAVTDRLELVQGAEIESCRSNECSAILVLFMGLANESLLKLLGSCGKPMAFVGHSRYSSLSTLLQALRAAPGKMIAAFYSADLDPGVVDRAVRYLSAVSYLRGYRLGVLGEEADVPPWLMPDRHRVEQVLGVELFEVPFEELVEEYAVSSQPTKILERVVGGATTVGVDQRSLEAALRLYTALLAIARRYELRGILVPCRRVMEEIGTSACIAAALMNDVGVDVECELDPVAGLSMAVMRAVAQGPCFVGRVSHVHGGRVVLSRCSAPISMSSGYAIRRPLGAELGAALSADLVPGRSVTALFLEPELRRGLVVRGYVLSGRPEVPYLCRSQLTLATESAELYRVLEGLRVHKLAVAFGNHAPVLSQLLRALGMEVIEVPNHRS